MESLASVFSGNAEEAAFRRRSRSLLVLKI
jgi:hypothetical protein